MVDGAEERIKIQKIICACVYGYLPSTVSSKRVPILQILKIKDQTLCFHLEQ